MIYDCFYIKCVFRWSENSVRFEILWESAFRRAKFCEILSHSVRYGMYAVMLTSDMLLAAIRNKMIPSNTLCSTTRFINTLTLNHFSFRASILLPEKH